jgi:hypothetical protein
LKSNDLELALALAATEEAKNEEFKATEFINSNSNNN